MHAELVNIPTDALVEMLFVILTRQDAVTAHDAREIEQIHRELQRRGDDQYWSFGTVH
jgi:hypothetical protein